MNPTPNSHLPRTDDLPLWQYMAAIGIPSIPFLVVFLRWSSLPTSGTPISFSDSVEMINAFLSAAAFAAVVLTLLLQRKDLHEQSRQFQESMEMQAVATYLSVVSSRREVISSKPVVADNADIRTLHLALSFFQLGRCLDRIEASLQQSSALAVDAEQAVLLQHVKGVRAVIARIATLDVARKKLEEQNWSDASIGQLRDWLDTISSDQSLPADLRVEIAQRDETIQHELSSILAHHPQSRLNACVSPVEKELDGIRMALVRCVRSAMFTSPV